MRLIDVESFGHPANGDNPAGSSAEATSAAWKTTATFALHAIAKFLNALLEIFLAAPAEILRSSLRAANAYRLCRTLSSCSIQRQTCDIIATLPPAKGTCPADTRASACQGRECVVHRQTLKATAGCGHRRGDVVRLFLLAGSEHQFGVHFCRWIFGIQHYFLRERGESHE